MTTPHTMAKCPTCESTDGTVLWRPRMMDGFIDKENHYRWHRQTTRCPELECTPCSDPSHSKTAFRPDQLTGTMDIYAKPESKVVFAYPENGYKGDQEWAAEHLRLGETYTVERADVGGWRTSIYLKETPGLRFNSVLFAQVATEPALCPVCRGEKGKPGQVNIMNGRPSSSGLFFGKGSVIGQKDCADPFHSQPSECPGICKGWPEYARHDHRNEADDGVIYVLRETPHHLDGSTCHHTAPAPAGEKDGLRTNNDTCSNCGADNRLPAFEPSPLHPGALEVAKLRPDGLPVTVTVPTRSSDAVLTVAEYIRSLYRPETEQIAHLISEYVEKKTALLNDRMLEAEAENLRMREALTSAGEAVATLGDSMWEREQRMVRAANLIRNALAQPGAPSGEKGE